VYVTLNKSNMFDLHTPYDDVMKQSGDDTDGKEQE
jgi:hypothetical protein